MGGLLHLIIYLFRSIRVRVAASGTGSWPTVNAVVTADPVRVLGSFVRTIEIVYSYRVAGELYTGMHEEPCFLGSDSEYLDRFTKGRNFVVPVKPGEPEVSLLRDADQSMGSEIARAD